MDSPVGAKKRPDEHPLYHEKNVVAYPQTPEAVAPRLGLRPSDMPKVLVVQFMGNDRSRLRHEPSLSVDVATNNWPWMIATKRDIDLPGDGLGPRLEEMLRAYADSVGDRAPAVPAELLQAATRIDGSRAGIQHHDPADAVAGEEDEGDEQAGAGGAAVRVRGRPVRRGR